MGHVARCRVRHLVRQAAQYSGQGPHVGDPAGSCFAPPRQDAEVEHGHSELFWGAEQPGGAARGGEG